MEKHKKTFLDFSYGTFSLCMVEYNIKSETKQYIWQMKIETYIRRKNDGKNTN